MRTEECKHHAKETSTQFHARFRLSKLTDSQQAPDSNVRGAEMKYSVQGFLEFRGNFVLGSLGNVFDVYWIDLQHFIS